MKCTWKAKWSVLIRIEKKKWVNMLRYITLFWLSSGNYCTNWSLGSCTKSMPWHIIIAEHTREKESLFTLLCEQRSVPLSCPDDVIMADWRSVFKLCILLEVMLWKAECWQRKEPRVTKWKSKARFKLGVERALIVFKAMHRERGSFLNCQVQ